MAADVSPPPDLARTFGLILGGLSRAIAARMARPRTARDRAAFPLLMLLWSRLQRSVARFASLAAKAAASDPPRSRAATTRRAPPSPRLRLPRGRAWLFPLVPEAACYGSQLQHFLSQPAMVAWLEASPSTARLLRPLCRMLAVPATALPPIVRRPSAKVAGTTPIVAVGAATVTPAHPPPGAGSQGAPGGTSHANGLALPAREPVIDQT